MHRSEALAAGPLPASALGVDLERIALPTAGPLEIAFEAVVVPHDPEQRLVV